MAASRDRGCSLGPALARNAVLYASLAHEPAATAAQMAIDRWKTIRKPSHVRADPGGRAAGRRDAGRERIEPIRSAGPEDDLRATSGEQERGRLADPAARACDGDDLAVDSRHGDPQSLVEVSGLSLLE
jgi:hypothetical protein